MLRYYISFIWNLIRFYLKNLIVSESVTYTRAGDYLIIKTARGAVIVPYDPAAAAGVADYHIMIDELAPFSLMRGVVLDPNIRARNLGQSVVVSNRTTLTMTNLHGQDRLVDEIKPLSLDPIE